MHQVSIWEKETFFAPQDVIIIGSGFVGLWSALFLKKKKPKLKITILDRGLIPTGASTRNAGFACFGSLSELIKDIQQTGIDKTLELVEMRYKGLRRIQKYFFADDIDFELTGGYELYENNKITSEELTENIQYINSILHPVTDSKKIFRIADNRINNFGFSNTEHLVKNNLEGYQHSGKLLKMLLQKVQGMGVQVLNGIEVKNIHKEKKTITVTTNDSFHFTSNQVLICTNAFTKALIPDIDIVPARGQVILTSPIKNLPWRGTFHSDEGYYYFRNLGNKVLLGGARNKAFADEESFDFSTTPFIQNHLQQYLDTVVLPNEKGKYTIEHQWAGIMAMGSEKLPIVRQIDDKIFCAVRMSGMGVALAPVVAEEITGKMLKA